MSRRRKPLDPSPVPVEFDAGTLSAVLAGGDTHGNAKWLRTLCKQAARWGCPVVFVNGDFGWWGFDDPGFPREVDGYAAHAGVVVIWLDGNHENHHDLNVWKRTAPRTRDGFRVLTPRVWYADRGHRWVWNSVRFGSLGGARSTDLLRVDAHGNPDDRTEGVDWWPGETVSRLDVRRLGDQPLDVLLTHDAPLGLDLPPRGNNDADRYGTLANQALISDAVLATQPQLVVHGHWHHRHSSVVNIGAAGSQVPVRVEGLNCGPEGQGHAWAVLSLPDLNFRDGHHLQAEVSRVRSRRGVTSS